MLSILQLRHGVTIKAIWKYPSKTPPKFPFKMIAIALAIVSRAFNNDHPNYVSKIRLASSKRKKILNILT